MKKQLLALSILTAITVPAYAEGMYGFADLGQSKMEIDFGEGWSASRTETAMDLGLGYDFNKNFAVEFSYRDLGEISERDEFSKSSISVDALQISLVGKATISEQIAAYGRFGFAKLSSDGEYIDYEDSDFNESSSDSANKIVFGIGASYKITEAFGVRVEYSRYAEWDDVTLSSTTIGATYHF
jgi:OmpA-OmpF porin, OOP family